MSFRPFVGLITVNTLAARTSALLLGVAGIAWLVTFERMRGMHRAWIEKAQEIRDLEANYGSKLMAARSPSHAASLCNEWMARRMAIVAHEQEMFASSWLWLLADMMNPPTAPPTEVSDRGA